MAYLTEINEIRRKQGEMLGRLKEINERNNKPDAKWSDEDTKNFAELERDLDTITEQRRKFEKLDGYSTDIGQTENRYKPKVNDADPDNIDPDEDDATRELRKGEDRVRGKLIEEVSYRSMANKFFRRQRYSELNRRAVLQSDSDIGGGYLTASEQMAGGLLKKLDELVIIRALASKISVPTADDLGILTFDNDPSDPNFTGELEMVQFDESMSFGKRKMHPRMQSKGVKISQTLIRKAPMNIVDFVINRFRYKWAVNEENLFLNGTGAEQPLGLLTASKDGINTDRDFVISTTSQIDTDKVIGAFYNQKAQYLTNARWLLTRDLLSRLRKAKTTGGDYLWQPSMQLGQPDLILGKPYSVSEFIDQSFGSGKYVGIFGDFSYYMIADALDMQFVVLNEMFQTTNQIGYIMRRAFDAQPLLPEAFTRLKA